MGVVSRIVAGLLIAAVRGYQAMVRPHLLGTCKFLPTCSEYAIEAIRVHGPVGGAGLALKRVARCRPMSMGGYDPVPPLRCKPPGQAAS